MDDYRFEYKLVQWWEYLYIFIIINLHSYMHNFFEQEKCGRVSATTLGTSHQKVSPNEYHSICVSWWEKKKECCCFDTLSCINFFNRREVLYITRYAQAHSMRQMLTRCAYFGFGIHSIRNIHIQISTSFCMRHMFLEMASLTGPALCGVMIVYSLKEHTMSRHRYSQI